MGPQESCADSQALDARSAGRAKSTGLSFDKKRPVIEGTYPRLLFYTLTIDHSKPYATFSEPTQEEFDTLKGYEPMGMVQYKTLTMYADSMRKAHGRSKDQWKAAKYSVHSLPVMPGTPESEARMAEVEANPAFQGWMQ